MNPILPKTEFAFRMNSMDFHTIAHVVYGNEYSLPPKFEERDVIIDVGANIGCFAAMCLARGAGRLHCYEPNRENYKLLCKNLTEFHAAGKAVSYNRAVWHKNEPLYLHDCGWNTAMHYAVPDKRDGFDRVETVRLDMAILNAITVPGKRSGVRLLKIDAEGAEWPCLYESERLCDVQELLVECHPTLTHKGYKCEMPPLVKHLEKQGFKVSCRVQDETVRNPNILLRAVNREPRTPKLAKTKPSRRATSK